MIQHIMLDYIEESKKIVQEILHNEQIMDVAQKIADTNATRMIFVGSGSSDNAAVISKFDFEKYADMEVTTYTPERFIDAKLPTYKTYVFIAFASATGNSRWTNYALQYAKKEGFPTIALSAVKESPFVKEADLFIDLLSGDEANYAKSKGVNATILTVRLLGLCIGYLRGNIKKEEYKKELEYIKEDIAQSAVALEQTKEYVNTHPIWACAKHITVIGDKAHYGSAQEFCLKLSETLNIPTKQCDMSEFVHGSHRGIDRNSYVIVILSDENKKGIIETIHGLEDIAYQVLVINATNLDFANQIKIANPHHLDMILSVSAVIQMFSCLVPQIIGIDINSKINEELVTKAYAMVDYSLIKY